MKGEPKLNATRIRAAGVATSVLIALLLLLFAANAVGRHGYFKDLAVQPTYVIGFIFLLVGALVGSASLDDSGLVRRSDIQFGAVLGLTPEIALSLPVALGIVGTSETHAYSLVGRVVAVLQLPGDLLLKLAGHGVMRWAQGLSDPETLETLAALILLNVINFVFWILASTTVRHGLAVALRRWRDA